MTHKAKLHVAIIDLLRQHYQLPEDTRIEGADVYISSTNLDIHLKLDRVDSSLEQ